MDRKLRQGGLISLDEGGSSVSREMTCGALEGKLHAGKGLLAYWERVHGLLGRSKGLLRSGEQPVVEGWKAYWERASGLLGRGEWPAGKHRGH